MKFRPQQSGLAFNLVASELDNGNCPTVEYLAGLKKRDKDVHETMLAKIKFRADNANIININISRPLKGDRYKGIYRLLAGGERLCYFFMPDKIIVLLNGYNK